MSENTENNSQPTGAPETLELDEELTTEAYNKLDEMLKRIYKQVQGKNVYSLNRKGKDTLAETLAKERDDRKKLEKTLAELGMPVEDAKKLITSHLEDKKKSQTEADILKGAIEKTAAENEKTNKALAELQEKLAAAERESLRLKVQNELKIPAELMEFLGGDTYEDLKAKGEKLKAHIKPEDPSQVNIGGGLNPNSAPITQSALDAQMKAGVEKAKKINASQAPQKEERRAY